MPAWAEALDTQMEAWRWYRDERGRHDLQGFIDSYLGDKGERAVFDSPKTASTFQLAVMAIPGNIWRADPIYVDREMQPLIESALATWQPERLLETDMLIPTGFMVLSWPLYLIDVRGKRMGIRGFLWDQVMVAEERDGAEAKPGVVLYLFSDVRDPDDYWPSYDQRFMRHLRARGTTLSLAHVVPCPFGMYTGHEDDLEWRQGSTGLDILQCILRLMAQTIAVRSEANAPRETRKRLERAQFPAKRITVVTLRRPAGERDPDAHRDVEWSRRWVVGGHWRNHWYKNLGVHRRIWISDYIKGPEDMPLVIPKAHVYRFAR